MSPTKNTVLFVIIESLNVLTIVLYISCSHLPLTDSPCLSRDVLTTNILPPPPFPLELLAFCYRMDAGRLTRALISRILLTIFSSTSTPDTMCKTSVIMSRLPMISTWSPDVSPPRKSQVAEERRRRRRAERRGEERGREMRKGAGRGKQRELVSNQ